MSKWDRIKRSRETTGFDDLQREQEQLCGGDLAQGEPETSHSPYPTQWMWSPILPPHFACQILTVSIFIYRLSKLSKTFFF